MPASDALDTDPRVSERAKALRRILLTAIGGLLALMIFAGMGALNSLRQLDTLEQELNRHFSLRSQALAAIVISIHVYNDSMERYLLQNGPTQSQPNMTEVTNLGSDVHTALRNYPGAREPEEQFLIQEIEQECAREEGAFATVLTWRDQEHHKRAEQFIGAQIIPRRTRILQITRDMSALNNRRMSEENQILAVKFQALQTTLMTRIVLALVAGLLLSLLSGVYILRLERQGRLRYEDLARSREELESLSARLVEVQEDERRAISRELHDEVGQNLGALLVELGQLSKLMLPDDCAVQGQIARLKSTVESAVKSVRDIALLLRPPMLDDLGLIAALEWQAREISRRGDMEVEVHSENVSAELRDEAKVCIYRVAQEALNNAAAHSAAKNAKVTVFQEAGKIIVAIGDDGHGFEANRVRGMGILGMEERVRRLGGTFHIDSVPGKGTVVHAEIPVASAHLS